MNIKKWIDPKSFILGICLCLVVVFFIASAKPAVAPNQTGERGMKQVTTNEVADMLKTVDAKIALLDEKLSRMEGKEDKLQETVMAMWRELYGMVNSIPKK